MDLKFRQEKNFTAMFRLVRKAALRMLMVSCLRPSSLRYIGSSQRGDLSLAETLDGDTIQQYTQLARDCGIWLSLGGFHERGPDWDTDRRICNSHIVLDSTGNIVSVYRKAHLFDVDLQSGVSLRESHSTLPGTELVRPISSPAGKVGLGVCYDLRFPELSLALAQGGAEILTYPSAFTVPTGLAHWEVLMRARAIETQCYVVAAAQTGNHNQKRTSYGHAMVVDPWGAVIAQCPEGTGLCYAEIDIAYLERVRREMPVWQHRRTDLYGKI
ncbi:hypothetical protein GDO86_019701, partial [Hymenochirus boettgeri]